MEQYCHRLIFAGFERFLKQSKSHHRMIKWYTQKNTITEPRERAAGSEKFIKMLAALTWPKLLMYSLEHQALTESWSNASDNVFPFFTHIAENALGQVIHSSVTQLRLIQ